MEAMETCSNLLEVGAYFDEYESFDKVLKTYEKVNGVKFRRADSHSIINANKSEGTQFDEKLVFRSARFECNRSRRRRPILATGKRKPKK